MNEIERKFLIKTMPNLTGIEPVRYERYYIRREPTVEERVQKKGNIYEYEKKEKISDLESAKEKKQITEVEFNKLKSETNEAIIRDSYLLNSKPSISVKIYHGKYEGLIRAEVEFDSLDDANTFTPLDWMGDEITNAPIGRDARLLDLAHDEFARVIEGHVVR